MSPQQRYSSGARVPLDGSRHRLAGSEAAPLSARRSDPQAGNIAPNARPWMAYAAVVRTRKARYLKDERVWDA